MSFFLGDALLGNITNTYSNGQPLYRVQARIVNQAVYRHTTPRFEAEDAPPRNRRRLNDSYVDHDMDDDTTDDDAESNLAMEDYDENTGLFIPEGLPPLMPHPDEIREGSIGFEAPPNTPNSPLSLAFREPPSVWGFGGPLFQADVSPPAVFVSGGPLMQDLGSDAPESPVFVTEEARRRMAEQRRSNPAPPVEEDTDLMRDAQRRDTDTDSEATISEYYTSADEVELSEDELFPTEEVTDLIRRFNERNDNVSDGNGGEIVVPDAPVIRLPALPTDDVEEDIDL